ncbi:hypothetical protein JTB14_034630 [Gonioctena quinquepunctata]|nr:hypothetical protein JTB14_034630 [Gonioctena quinquepunctata]
MVQSQLCSNSSDILCDCKRILYDKSHLPGVSADCSAMDINNIPDKLENAINILDLSENNIENLDAKLHNLSSHNLHVLILKLNKINRIDGEFFLKLPNLHELDLSYNNITSLDDSKLFQNQKELHKLDLSFNGIKTLPDKFFQPLNKLRILDMSFNNLGDFLTQSKNVLIDNLKLSPDLSHLSLEGLNITNFPIAFFDGFDQLVALHLSDNALTMVPSVPYAIQKLDLSGNPITFLSARHLNYPSLKVLQLNEMPSLASIHHYAFYNLYALEKLAVTNCPKLEEFNELAFDVASKDTSHRHLKSLSLSGNRLTSLNESYKFFFRHMDHIDLRHNPWQCDCDILWIQEFSSILYKAHEIKCNLSPQDSNPHLKHVLDLHHSDLKECFPGEYGKRSHRVLIAALAIAVIVLCGIIFYLLKYPMSCQAQINHIVGPQSPYRPASTSEQT